MSKPRRGPGKHTHLVQTHVSEKARDAIKLLADRDADGSIALFLRKLIMRELYTRRGSLRKRAVPILQPPPAEEEKFKRVRIDIRPELLTETLEGIDILATLEGQSHAGWLKALILRELSRKRSTIQAAKRTKSE